MHQLLQTYFAHGKKNEAPKKKQNPEECGYDYF